MNKLEILSRPDLMEAIGELFVLGLITDSQLTSINLELRIEAERRAGSVFRNQIYAKLAMMKDVAMTMESLKNLDYCWRKPIDKVVVEKRLERLKEINLY